MKIKRITYLLPKFDFYTPSETEMFKQIKLKTVELDTLTISTKYNLIHCGSSHYPNICDVYIHSPEFGREILYEKSYWYINTDWLDRLPRDVFNMYIKAERRQKLKQILL